MRIARPIWTLPRRPVLRTLQIDYQTTDGWVGRNLQAAGVLGNASATLLAAVNSIYVERRRDRNLRPMHHFPRGEYGPKGG